MKSKEIVKYKCFSFRQNMYLERLGFKGEFKIHHVTNKRFWEFELTPELSFALRAWSTMREVVQ